MFKFLLSNHSSFGHSLVWTVFFVVVVVFEFVDICLCQKLVWVFINYYYYMACVCSQYNVCSDWLMLGHYSPVVPTGRLWTSKTKVESLIINSLLTLNVWSFWENLKPRLCCIDLTIYQYGKVLVQDFP